MTPRINHATTAQANHRMIELARRARGLSQTALAKKIGCSQGTLSKMEQGIHHVSDELLDALSVALEFPRSFFHQGGWTYPAGIKYRRARKRLSATLRDQIDAENNIRARVIEKLLKSVEIKKENILSLSIDEYGSPSEVARALRETWGVPRGPVKNLTGLFESNGGIVVHADFQTDRFDGVYYGFPSVPPIIFLNSVQPGDRMRFSLAHEIGHIVMHQIPVVAEEAEPQTNEFAAEFMMPEADIRQSLFRLTLEQAAMLKLSWGMSMAAIIRRAYDLHMIPASRYKSLNIQLRKACRGTTEPAELNIERERPNMLFELIKIHREQLEYTFEELSAIVHLNPDRFRDEYMPARPHAKIISLDNARRWLGN